MLYHLLVPLSKYFIGFNLFRYITFRTAGAIFTALLISFLLGPGVIRWLREKRVDERIREDGPSSHLTKEGTPTMGGIMILTSVLLSTLLWAQLKNEYTLLLILTTLWMGGIGLFDDYLKAKRGKSKGLVGRYKLAGQTVWGLGLGLILSLFPPHPGYATSTSLPFFKDVVINFGLFYIPFVAIVIVGSSNAINLTDGLDGLAIGLVGICALTMAVVTYVTGRVDFSRYLKIFYLPGCGELAIYCGAMVGASLGFLWFNAFPAQVFMGDTGALALGGALGTIAVLAKQEILLCILGGIFVAEAASVILQVVSFRTRGRRIFKMAPFHHHFELLGWKEPKVVVRLWIIGIILALLSLSTLKIR